MIPEVIPDDMHRAILESFWSMLQECETQAEINNDLILKHLVTQWYNQWNEAVDTDLMPIWAVRETIANTTEDSVDFHGSQ